ncbi:helix-turn-helix transcriptional regulator [Glutamicibacter sp. TV12E]|uniref:helix-turn-helix transcriptional regulator n=1 Tax=Glutamicibacter sp. TV12E TaxID=3446362 RepID=UPI0040337EA3
MQSNDLGSFLKHRRATVSPADHGISVRDGRRVAGLRREEVAHLAGLSVAYYTRLEQGTSTNASDQVIQALAAVLLLDDDERAHLKDLNGVRATVKLRRPKAESAPGPMLDLLAAMPQVPALLLGRRNDILAWNHLGHQLLGSHLDFQAPQNPQTRPSTTRMLFLDPQIRAQEGQWEHYAGTHVAFLRMLSGRYPEDRDLAELIGELTMHSREFAEFWASSKVRECTYGQRIVHHPQVGTIELTYHVLSQPALPEYRIEFYTTEADSPSRAAVEKLAGL